MADETRRISRDDSSPAGRDQTRRTAAHRHQPPKARLDPLRIVAAAAGFYLLILGLVALARSGFDAVTLFEPAVEVGGLTHTPLWALLTIVLGLLLLAGGTGAVARSGMRFLGALMGVVGVVWLIEPDAFNAWLGVRSSNGLQQLIIGVAVFVTSFTEPINIGRRTVYEE